MERLRQRLRQRLQGRLRQRLREGCGSGCGSGSGEGFGKGFSKGYNGSELGMLWMRRRKCVYASTAERLGAGGMQHMPYARTELAHDVRLSLLRSRSGAAASASASAKRARSGLRGSMEKTRRRERPTSSRRLHPTEGETTSFGSPPIQLSGGLQLQQLDSCSKG
jgi:hypothetical protein